MAHGCSVGKSQSTYKMCWQWKIVQAHILKYQHLQYFILLFSMASNYIQVWREQWTYVMHNYFAQTRKLACPNTDKKTAIRGWELGSPPSLLLWATSCQSAECCRLPLAWCLQALHCCCCSSWHYCFLASYFHY